MSDRLQDGPAVSVHPPTLFFSALALGFALRVFLGGWLDFAPKVVMEGAGALLVIAGIGFVVSGVSAFAEGGEKLAPPTPSDQLFTSGPFRFSRNPIYLAMMLIGAGLGVATQNLWMIVTTILAGAVIHFFVIPQEEEYLARRFGEDYRVYHLRVRRWL